MYHIFVLFVFQALVYLFRNNSVSEYGKKETFSFNSTDSAFFSTIKSIGKPRDLGDEVEYPTSFDFLSLQQMVATPTLIYISY